MTSRAGTARSRATLIVGVLLATTFLIAGLATPVGAHAYLAETDPANGDQLEETPEEIRLTYSGDGVVTPEVTVEGPDGEDISGEAEVNPEDSQEVIVPLEDDSGEGMYIVDWEVLAEDGHTTGGSVFFSVGEESLDRDAVVAAYDDEESENIAWLESAGKGLLLVALVGLVGVPITARLAMKPAANRFETPTAILDRQLTLLVASLAGLLVVGVIGLGLARVGSLSPTAVAQFVAPGNPIGLAWAIQLMLTGGLLAIVVLGLGGALSGRTVSTGALLFALAITLTIGTTSHSATAIDQLQGTLVAVGHILGAGLWVGGLAVVALLVPGLVERSEPADRTAIAASVIRRYSLLALAGVTIAAATGLVLAAWHVPGPSALIDSVYGLALSAKTLLVFVALGLGGLTRFVLLRRLEPAGDAGLVDRLLGSGQLRTDGGDTANVITALKRATRLEVGVLVGVLLLSGLLTSAPTAAVADATALSETTIEREGEIDLELVAMPAEDREDGLTVNVDEPIVFETSFTDDGEPVDSDQPVRLLADHKDGTTIEVDLDVVETGTYATVQPLPEAGEWELRLTGAPAGQFTSEWVNTTVEPAAGDEPPEDESAHDHAHDDHEAHTHSDDEHDHTEAAGDSRFGLGLQLGALVIGVVGTAAIGREVVGLRNRR